MTGNFNLNSSCTENSFTSHTFKNWKFLTGKVTFSITEEEKKKRVGKDQEQYRKKFIEVKSYKVDKYHLG